MPVSHIVVVDDEPLILTLLEDILSTAGYRVTTTASGTGMRQILSEQAVSLVLLDVGLEDADGFLLAREITRTHGLPLIFVTGYQAVSDKVVGFETGADDYITKPFDQRELLARIKAVIRRGGHHARNERSHRLHFSGFTLDLEAYALHPPYGPPLELTGFELSILACLARHPQQVLSRDDISLEVSGKVRPKSDRTIDVLISKLRRKLEGAGAPGGPIQTVRGVGYKLAAEVESDDTSPSN